MRLTPSGTDGGRKHPTRTPCCAQRSAAASASVGVPIGTVTTADGGTGRETIAARAHAFRRTAAASEGSAARMRRLAKAPPAQAGDKAVSKTKVRAAFTKYSVTSRVARTAPPWL